jgi:hypothetical protein
MNGLNNLFLASLLLIHPQPVKHVGRQHSLLSSLLIELFGFLIYVWLILDGFVFVLELDHSIRPLLLL